MPTKLKVTKYAMNHYDKPWTRPIRGSTLPVDNSAASTLTSIFLTCFLLLDIVNHLLGLLHSLHIILYYFTLLLIDTQHTVLFCFMAAACTLELRLASKSVRLHKLTANAC